MASDRRSPIVPKVQAARAAGRPMAAAAAHTGPIPALEYIQDILFKCAVPTDAGNLDRIVAGDPTQPVTGIATMSMATLASLKAAAAARSNLIVTHGPAFWESGDSLGRMEDNALFVQKRDFLRDNRMVCFRLHDTWPVEGPNGIATGMARTLGWENNITDAKKATVFDLPKTTLLGLAKELSARLGDRTMRMVGDPTLPVSKVAAKWGDALQIPTIRLLNTPVDAVVCGYTHEWEAVEYAQDMIAAGKKKGLVLLGDVKSTDGGMAYCAMWLRTFITDTPVRHIPAIEPYWNPQHPEQVFASA